MTTMKRNGLWPVHAATCVAATVSCLAASWTFAASSVTEEWIAERLRDMTRRGMLDPTAINSVFQQDNKPYALDPTNYTSAGYVGLARDYVLHDTATSRIPTAAAISLIASVATGICVLVLILSRAACATEAPLLLSDPGRRE